MRKFHPLLTPKRKLLIMLFDIAVLSTVVVLAHFFRFGNSSLDFVWRGDIWVILFLMLASFYVLGAYDLDVETSGRIIGIKTSASIFIGLFAVIVINYLRGGGADGTFGRGVLLGSIFVFGCLAVLYRVVAVDFFNRFRRGSKWLLLINPKYFEYFRSDFERKGMVQGINVEVVSCDLDLVDKALEQRWSGVICAFKSEDLRGPLGKLVIDAKLAGHNVMSLNQFYEMHWFKVPVYAVGPEWFFGTNFMLIHNPIGLRMKRLADLLLCITLLICVWPIMLIVLIAVKLEGHGAALYKQVRAGVDGRLFTIYKFRSMVANAEVGGAQWALENDMRITKVGKIIRLTRLDELPQLWNVFKGDMSFIGPRPERPEFNELLIPEIPFYNLRNLVRPGLTGWAQVCYPYGASIDDSREKLQYDLFYIKNYSAILDFIIILRTIRVVVFSRGR